MGNFIENSMNANLEKITRCVIQPIQSLWGYEVDEYTAKAYIDELRYFSEDVLNLAIKNLRRNSEKRPTMAKVMRACYDARTQLTPSERKAEKPKQLTAAQVDEVMRGTLGAIAYREGYWWQLYEFLTLKAKDTFVTGDQLATIKDEASRANDSELARKVTSSPDVFRETFTRFYETLMRRKEQVLAQYGWAQ